MRSILPRSHAAHEIPRDVVSRTGRAGVSTAALRLFQLNVRSRPDGSATAVKPPPLPPARVGQPFRAPVSQLDVVVGGPGGSGSRSCSVTPIRMSTSPPPDGRLRPCSARGSAWRRGWRATKNTTRSEGHAAARGRGHVRRGQEDHRVGLGDGELRPPDKQSLGIADPIGHT